jgi:hypothetical protein
MAAHCHCGLSLQFKPLRMGQSSMVDPRMGNQRCLYSGGSGQSCIDLTSCTGDEGKVEIRQSLVSWTRACSGAKGIGAAKPEWTFWRRGWLIIFALTKRCSGCDVLYATRSGIALSAIYTISSSTLSIF